ncbi:MAG TPA: polynucleotide adenylyltransferase PcnB, partial [Steroidobacteraceae bacterium]|nr:polynucleotide adenylyltransferase PcnB [Steroidobacteraceae bacterium]
DAPAANNDRVLDTHGRLLRDNVYGTLEEDVWRRDFTVNALYYNIADFSLWDFVGGARDVAARRLRLIGDPEIRYREDPVRMLRGARFEAKLGFTIEESTAAPIAGLRHLLAGVPAPRLFDETLKLFLTGHGERSLAVMRQRQLLEVLLPSVERYLTTHAGNLVEQLLVQGLRNTDARVSADKPVTPTFLFALLLYGPIAQYIESLPPQRWHEAGAILEACDRALREASRRVTIPRRVALGVREMYGLQPRLEQPRGKRALRLLEQPRFRAGFDLLSLRAQFGLASAAMADWWTRLQETAPEERAKALDALPATAATPPAGSAAHNTNSGGVRTRRRRRRRRSPGPA